MPVRSFFFFFFENPEEILKAKIIADAEKLASSADKDVIETCLKRINASGKLILK